MGSSYSSFKTSDYRWHLFVRTGDRKSFGTDTNVFVSFRDAAGRQTDAIKLQCSMRDNFEAGRTDHFPLGDLKLDNGDHLHEVAKMELWRDSSSSEWYCDLLSLIDFTTGASIQFPVQRWIRPGVQYQLLAFDTCLPQDDPHTEFRQEELEYKRTIYQIASDGDPKLPVNMKFLPAEESFTDGHVIRIEDFLKKGRWGVMKTLFFESDPKSLVDILTYYKHTGMPIPPCHEFWKTDEWFGVMRVAGCNPCHIRLCSEIPANFAVTDELVSPHLEGMKLEEALSKKKLFLHDLSILSRITHRKGDLQVVSPYGLFYLNKANQLRPVAIQLYCKPATDNPVFTPSDPPMLWLFVKMWFNHADSTWHEPCIHLGYTHIVLGAVCMLMNRCLATNHPVTRLLAQHFTYLLANNWRGLPQLVDEGEIYDRINQVGAKGCVEQMQQGFDDWRFDREGSFKKNLEHRGLLSPEVLPYYPYRDDGLLLHGAIERYVTNVLRHYYGDDNSKLQQDEEVKQWLTLIALPLEQNGGGVKGFPKDGNIDSVEDVVWVCTELIFTSVVQHSAVNYPQYDIYGFPVNALVQILGHPPNNKNEITEADIMKALPPRKLQMGQMVLSQVLSLKNWKALCDWDMRFQFDPPALEAERKFKQELNEIHDKIMEINKDRPAYMKYYYLDPKTLPNATNV